MQRQKVLEVFVDNTGLAKIAKKGFAFLASRDFLLVHRQRMQRDNHPRKFLPGHPVYELAYYILAEVREIVVAKQDSGCARPSTMAWGSGRQSTWELSYRLKNTPGRAEFLSFFPTPDGKAVYLQEEDRDYKGELDDVTRAEISGDKVDDCTLTELLQRLNMHNVTRLAIAYRQNAAAGLARIYIYMVNEEDRFLLPTEMMNAFERASLPPHHLERTVWPCCRGIWNRIWAYAMERVYK